MGCDVFFFCVFYASLCEELLDQARVLEALLTSGNSKVRCRGLLPGGVIALKCL